MAALRAVAEEKTRAYRIRFIGSKLEAIALHTPPVLQARGRTAALTENFIPVQLEGRLPANRLVRVRVTGLAAEGVLQGFEAASSVSQSAAAMSV